MPGVSFNTLDLLIILFALIAVVRGIQVGFFRQVLSLAGFFGGLFLGSALAAFTNDSFSIDRTGQTILTLLLTFGLALIFAGIGERYGQKLQFKLSKRPLVIAESLLGVVVSVVSTVILTWLMASVLVRLPTANIAATISESRIMRVLDKKLPPAPAVMARIGQLISPEGFPRVFTGIEPFTPDAGTAHEPDVLAAAEKAAISTVRIESLGCGGIVFGSGFVIDQGLIATNAHVIAGIDNPVVADQAGRHRAVPVWFDSGLDFALLRVQQHAGQPLTLAGEEMARGTTVAALGYPGGQSFSVSPAVVLNRHTAIGRDIYDRSLIRRDVYELQTRIKQGNSGGPIVLSDGTVAGMIFGKSAAHETRGFAITSMEIQHALEAARSSGNNVPTGRCVHA